MKKLMVVMLMLCMVLPCLGMEKKKKKKIKKKKQAPQEELLVMKKEKEKEVEKSASQQQSVTKRKKVRVPPSLAKKYNFKYTADEKRGANEVAEFACFILQDIVRGDKEAYNMLLEGGYLNAPSVYRKNFKGDNGDPERLSNLAKALVYERIKEWQGEIVDD